LLKAPSPVSPIKHIWSLKVPQRIILFSWLMVREKKLHLITFSSGQHSSQIDFVLIRREERPNWMDCKVIPGECVVTQHKLLVADFRFQIYVRRDRDMKITRTRWWKLKWDISQVFKNRVIAE
jgi:hypothetical protein